MVFVDSNVLLYSEDEAFPEKKRIAGVWLDHLWEVQAGALSAQVLNEYFWNATRKLRYPVPPEVAWKTVKAFYRWNPRPIDCDLIDHAHEVQNRYHLSWWDSLIAAAAIDQRCEVLLSEDLQDGLDLDGTRVRNPFRFSPEDFSRESSSRQLNQPRRKYVRP